VTVQQEAGYAEDALDPDAG
jgi:hypothetical protein